MRTRTAFIWAVLIGVSAGRLAASTTPALAASQEEAKKRNEKAEKQKQDKKSGIAVLPVVFYTPETKLAFGVGGLYYFPLTSDKAVDRPSNIAFSGVYTQKKQTSIELNPDLYLGHGYHIQAVLRYSDFPDYFYGVGNATSADLEEPFTSKYWWLSVEALKRMNGPVNVGFQYFFDETKLTNVEAGGFLDSGDVTGSGGGTVSGLGPFLTYDDRDSIFFPTQGSYHQFSALTFGPALGSDFRFNRFYLELRKYHGLSPARVLAFQARFLVQTGDPPFWRMGLLGGEESMRGYYLGRYRDRNLITFQAEYRWVPVFWRVGLVAFAGLGDVADSLGHFDLGRFEYSYGLGLRLVIDPKQRLHIRLDFGFGRGTSGFYFTAGEAF
jgi:outer membrane protein assembly factor BamA